MQLEATITSATPATMVIPCTPDYCGGHVDLRVVAKTDASPSQALAIELRAYTPDGVPVGDPAQAEPIEAPYLTSGEGATFARRLALPDHLDGVGYAALTFSTADPAGWIRVVATI